MAKDGPSLLLTGAAGNGIGNQLCRVFHERGFRVIATARDASKLSDLAALGMETISMEVNDEDSIQRCYAEVSKLVGDRGLDYLYQNAGVNYTVPSTDIVLDEVRFTFETNLFSVMRINQVFIPLLLAARGTIVATGSVAGVFPFWFGSGYNASKAALKSYLDTMRVELSPFGVHVVNVITAGVRSDIARTVRTLPDGSIFGRVRHLADVYTRRLRRSQTSGMATRAYAEEVAAKVATSRGRGGWLSWNRNEIWAGGRWRMIWFGASLDWWWPGGIWGSYIKRVEGLRIPRDADADFTKKLR